MRALLLAVAAIGCGDRQGAPPADRSSDASAPVVVYAAGSLARPLRAALESLRVSTGIPYTLETAGSLELARRLTDLGKSADLVALADEEVFARLLMPVHTTWYARFARNRMVLAHGERSAGLAQAKRGNWRGVLTRGGVEVGRSDPDLDPAGYRTLMLFQLAERHYGEAGLAQRLEAAAPRRHMRPKSAELVALLQAGELDYAWMYESSARGSRLPFLSLPPALDLGDESLADSYAKARVRVMGATRSDTLELHGVPIRYGITIPLAAPHPVRAEEALRFLLGGRGAAAMRGEHLDVVSDPVLRGGGAPNWLRSLAVTSARR